MAGAEMFVYNGTRYINLETVSSVKVVSSLMNKWAIEGLVGRRAYRLHRGLGWDKKEDALKYADKLLPLIEVQEVPTEVSTPDTIEELTGNFLGSRDEEVTTKVGTSATLTTIVSREKE
jgi:hypothetical protein